MYSEILVLAGATFITYSLYLARRIITLVEWRYMRKPWRVLICMMLTSLMFYIIYLKEILASPVLSSILFFWSVFSMIAARAAYQLVDGLKSSEVNIKVTRRSIESDQTEVETMKHELESKNEEMDRLLAEVYALRNAMEKGETKRINRILNELKKELK